MINSGRLFPKNLIEHWPEIFGDVKLNGIPLKYLHTVLINFKDGNVWEIKTTKDDILKGWPSFEYTLSELCKTYEDSIDDIDFKLDTNRVKKDVERWTKTFLKKLKL